jgi:hypothetical protein
LQGALNAAGSRSVQRQHLDPGSVKDEARTLSLASYALLPLLLLLLLLLLLQEAAAASRSAVCALGVTS